MIFTGMRAAETASRVRAERQKLSNDAASADAADIGETPRDIGARWDDFMVGLERRVLRLGAGGLSLGLLNGSRVHTFNRGFSERTSAMYATISAEAELPGPATVRSGQAQYFDSHEIAGARYPKSVGIHTGTQFSAAACLPLVIEAERLAFGYLAVHYRGARIFDRRLQGELSRTAEATTLAIHEVLNDTERQIKGDGDRTSAELQSELLGLRKAMQTRAEIEQATGILMARFALDAAQALDLIRHVSNEANVKVGAMAHAIVTKVEVLGSTPAADSPGPAPWNRTTT